HRREIQRPVMPDAVTGDLHRVAASAAESLRQRPVGAAAGERKAELEVRRSVIIYAAGKAEIAGAEIVGADHGIPVVTRRSAIGRAPGGLALVEALRAGRLCGVPLQHSIIGERQVRRKRIIGLGKAGRPVAGAAAAPPPVPSAMSESRLKKSLNSWNVLVLAPLLFSPSSFE